MMVNDPSDFLNKELFRMLCGRVLGQGAARTVYEHAFDPTVVIKFEHTAGNFQNIMEWEAWQRIKHTDLSQWFAPCLAISPNGCVLAQRRTRRPTNYPDKVPAFFTDLKLDNFGILPHGNCFTDEVLVDRNPKGTFVCHDYGLTLLFEKGMTKRMVKADWWSL